ncbi:4-hydroxy-tetrahydrodipicolinate synthase [Lichenibacterium minor]|uniref:4-hydroxy-tetrahydrodipicolinate synthase n=1 Tax=Lichenibacterium minor TaxID=2316528 RepID=A0A4Q2U3D1_9HYPH|nr:4-hydroxy-tetrahydrodipicolinate synthase [Lichenibacterium minor]RYC29441.1 4-hydroxy-tetrahydrodipicolinate synthase [Lichenibacterium minor]
MFLQGSMTALATPFTSDGLDQETFEHFVEWQITEGTQGLVPCGTTGEASTLTAGERRRLIRVCVECASGLVPVVAGTGTNCTATTIEQTRAAKAAGADAALVVTPYYNRPTQEGLYRHYAAIASAVDIPLIIYNVPRRTGVDLHFSTLEQLVRIPTIVGIKDASGDVDRPRVVSQVAGPRFVQLCGDDASAVTFNLAGGRGCISVAANVIPSLCRDMQHACRTKEWGSARDIQHRLQRLVAALNRETNPGPIKHALSLMHPGFCREPRLPLVGVVPSTADEVRDALARLGLLSDDVFPVPPWSSGGHHGKVAPTATVWRAE